MAQTHNLSTEEADVGRLLIQASLGYINNMRPAWATE